jgi:precorrin-2/cobalt-factor-2 C20-methyltransferase
MFNNIIFVSLGPGDPELITVKGLKALSQADVIFCPSTILSNGGISSRAKDILLELGIDNGKIIPFEVPMNKDRTEAMSSYKNVSLKIAEQYKKGYKIAVTAEGDAGFYSSVRYISENLHQQNIATKQIAGIPAFIACGALANLHIVKQEEELIVIPGISTYENLKENVEEGKSVVIMKPSQCESSIKKLLSEGGILFHYFENVGVPKKEFYTKDVEKIRNRIFPYFSLLIIHKNK